MAEQVRPGLTNPARFKGPQQSADLIRCQPTHSIRARGKAPFTEAECMAAISTCFDRSGKALGNRGASMYEPAQLGSIATVTERPCERVLRSLKLAAAKRPLLSLDLQTDLVATS